MTSEVTPNELLLATVLATIVAAFTGMGLGLTAAWLGSQMSRRRRMRAQIRYERPSSLPGVRW